MFVPCVSIVGKVNNPLYLRTYAESDGLHFHYIVHTSLDVVDEKVNAAKRAGAASGPNTDMYLGMLYLTEEYRVYGYITNTKIKFILVVEDVDIKDIEVKSFFKRLHLVFSDGVCNPFYTPDQRIVSRSFDQKVDDLVKDWSSKN